MVLLPQQADSFLAAAPQAHLALETRTLATKGTRVVLSWGAGGLRVSSVMPGQSGESLVAGEAPIPLLDAVTWDGRKLPVKWRLVRTTTDPQSPRVRFWFKCDSPRLEMDSLWVGSDIGGPIEHTVALKNLTGDAVTFSPLESLALRAFKPKGHDIQLWWVDKGAGGPSEPGVHVVPLVSGVFARVRSTGYSSDHPKDGIPWATIYDKTARRGLYLGIESSSRVRMAFDVSADRVGLKVGADPDDPDGRSAVVRVARGESYVAPTVFVGAFDGDVDDGGNQLRHWVASSLRPRSTAALPLATLNTWGNGMVIDAKRSTAMAELAAQMGMELFHIDAGWFRSPGDWRPNPDKFPDGMRPISDLVHAKGMRFGLWVAWTQGGLGDDSQDNTTVLNVNSRRDWFASPPPPGWRPDDFVGSDLCLSVPDAQKWCVDLLDKLVQDYGVDMLEHDQRMVVQQCAQTVSPWPWGAAHPHTSSAFDISRRAAEGYYRVMDTVRRDHPGLMFEDCVNGGRMVDYGVVRRATYISISDTYTPLANRQAFFDASFALPPAMCECYVQAVPSKSDAEFQTMLRSGMMGWFSLMQDPTQWTARQVGLATAEIHRYKTVLRPLIAEGDLFHLTERPRAGRFDSVQYASVDKGRAAAFVFRNGCPVSSFRLRWRGLDPRKTYSCSSGKATITMSGSDLMSVGADVLVTDADGSDVVLATALR